MANTHELYLFSQSSRGDSLLRVDISLSQNEQDCKVSCPQVVRHFYTESAGRDFECRRVQMGCGKFGSKLYILGGLIHHLGVIGPRPSKEDYPLDVIVFDPSAPEDDESNTVSHMNSLKLSPIVFEADEKLFALGTLYDHDYFEHIPKHDVFEVYDPKHNQWETLKPPPLTMNRTSYEWAYSSFVNSTTVIIQGEDTDLHFFNPKTYEWVTYIFPPHEEYIPFRTSPSRFEDDLYWPFGDGIFMKKGPISVPAQYNNNKGQVPSMDWGDIDSDEFPEPSKSSQISNPPVIIHLGDGQFCLLESISHFDGIRFPSRMEICFDIYIHKLIQPDNTSLRAKCLHAARFTLDSGPYWIGGFTRCHLIKKSWNEKSDDLPDLKKRKV